MDDAINEGSAQLPVPVDPRQPRPSLQRNGTSADFLSQLIAEKQKMALQRGKRREPVETALNAYAQGSTIAVRRMPQGYRKTVVA
jgi:hypothetical protein